MILDRLKIATRAYTEPRGPKDGANVDREIVSLLVVAQSESAEAFDELLRQHLEHAERDLGRAAELLNRERARNSKTGQARKRVARLKGKAMRAAERGDRLRDLLKLSDAEREQLLQDLTNKIVLSRRERREELLRHRLEDNHRPVLFFDTETRVDPSLKLMIGTWRLCVWGKGRLCCIQEGIFHADDLPESDMKIVRDYVRTNRTAAGVDRGHPAASPRLRLISERQFVRLLYNHCFKHGPERSAVLAGLNLNFDVSRLAVHWSPSRTDKYENGFTLQLHEGYDGKDGKRRESAYHPRYGAKHLTSKKALKGFIDSFAGHIIDVRTLMFALSNRGHSLESGCEAYKVMMPDAEEAGYEKRDVDYGIVYPEALTYCRDDVLATQVLYEKVMGEFDRHPIPLQATQAYSAASVGKGHLGAFGVIPRLELQPDFDKGVLGQAMSALYGGRVECKICRVFVPVAYCDLLSAYTTVNCLLDLWSHVIAERIKTVDATDEVRRLLEQIDLEQVLDPSTWKHFATLVQVAPDGDILPVRAAYKPSGWNIGLNHLHSETPLWYALPDVINAKIIGRKTPKILRAIRFVPEGVQSGLGPVKLRDVVEVDPHENFFKIVVQQRHERADKKDDTGEFLKTLANSTGFGIYGEMIRSELAVGHTEKVLVADGYDDPYLTDTHAPERRGDYFFSPMAAMITAGTRLLLGIIERLVTDAGGSWTFCDTDSFAIVSNEHGGLLECAGGPHRTDDGKEAVLALSWDQVDQIRDRMQQLNPYEGKAGEKSILELESENFDENGKRRELLAYSVSSKRYALLTLNDHGEPQIHGFTDPDQHDEPDVRALHIHKRSDHGLGYLINPVNPDDDSRDYILAGWEWILRDALGLNAPKPAWFKRPSLRRAANTTPRLLDNFKRFNDGKDAREQMRPFTFMMVAKQKPAGKDPLTGEVCFQSINGPCALVAPYESDPRKWSVDEYRKTKGEIRKGDLVSWINHYNPDRAAPHEITTHRNPFAEELGDPDVRRC